MSDASRAVGRPRVAVVVLAAGSGSRLRSQVNKAFLPLGDRAVVAWSLRHALALPDVVSCTLVIAEPDRHLAETMLASDLPGEQVAVIAGGATRHGSEWCALQALAQPIEAGEIDIVVIHDGARPVAAPGLFRDVVHQAAAYGGAIPGRRQSGAVAISADSGVTGEWVTVQTPQAFRADELLAAYARAAVDDFEGTDTASCLERYSTMQVRVVEGPVDNIKITYPGDLEAVARHLTRHP